VDSDSRSGQQVAKSYLSDGLPASCTLRAAIIGAMRIILAVLVVGLVAAAAFAQDLGTFPEYEGIGSGW